jgi:hypothetical protein
MIRMAIQVVFIDDANGRRDVHEIIGIDRDRLCPAGLGLSLAEAKEITAGIQQVLTDVQVAEWQADQRACPGCRNQRSLKGHETVQNLGVLTPRAGTGGGPTARRQRDPAQASRWRSRSEPSASDERLVVTSACVAVRSFAGATATARYFP